MPTPQKAESGTFTKDVLGRYICNGLDEAIASTNSANSPDARLFDVIVVGAGSFGAEGGDEDDGTAGHQVGLGQGEQRVVARVTRQAGQHRVV